LARTALRDEGTVLDVGCGGGGSSIPLAGGAALVTRIVGVDEQAAMLANFAKACDERGIEHAEVEGRWPDVAGAVGACDVAVCHHVAYNVADIAPFLRQLTLHARRKVVVELTERHPTSPFNPLWQRFWGLERPSEPSADLFVEVVRELGWTAEVHRFERPPAKPSIDRADYVAFVRRRLCLTSDRDAEVEEALSELPPLTVMTLVTVAWEPDG
jgi:SAM-dependent methyltransferase